jgi:hypothetical protein
LLALAQAFGGTLLSKRLAYPLLALTQALGGMRRGNNGQDTGQDKSRNSQLHRQPSH